MNTTPVCGYGFTDYYLERYPGEPVPPIDPEQVKACRDFIRRHTRPDSRGHSSYALKHTVERMYNIYVQNGALIQAAILEGVRWERIRYRGPNARIFVTLTKQARGML